jgi:hypothetical protein
MLDVGIDRLNLQDVFEEQARWRREKAEQYPNDERNLEAAAIFDHLAATVGAIPEDVFVVFSELGPDVDDGFRDAERWSEMLCEVGFHSVPETAEDFVRSYIADRTVRGR